MDLTTFVANIAAQFEDTDSALIKPDTEFRSLEEWSSLIALSFIGMIDEEYGVTIKGDDIRNSKTINDLYEVVKSKL